MKMLFHAVSNILTVSPRPRICFSFSVCITQHKLYDIKSKATARRISKARNLIKIFFFLSLFYLVYLRPTAERCAQTEWIFKRYIYQIEIILANAKWWWSESALFSRLRHVVGIFTWSHQVPYQCSMSQATWYHQYFPLTWKKKNCRGTPFSLQARHLCHKHKIGWEINCENWTIRNEGEGMRPKRCKRNHFFNARL